MNKDEGECRCQIQRSGNKSTEENTLYHKGYIIPEKQPKIDVIDTVYQKMLR